MSSYLGKPTSLKAGDGSNCLGSYGFRIIVPETVSQLIDQSTDIVIGRVGSQTVVELPQFPPEQPKSGPPPTERPKDPDPVNQYVPEPTIVRPTVTQVYDGYLATDSVVTIERVIKGHRRPADTVTYRVMGDGNNGCDPNDPMPAPGTRLMLFLKPATGSAANDMDTPYYTVGLAHSGRYLLDASDRLALDPRMASYGVSAGSANGLTVADLEKLAAPK